MRVTKSNAGVGLYKQYIHNYAIRHPFALILHLTFKTGEYEQRTFTGGNRTTFAIVLV